MERFARQQYIDKAMSDLRLKHSRFHVNKKDVAEDDNKEIFEVLIVEDNLMDVQLAKKSLESSGIKHNLTAVNDGREALKYLERESPYQDMPIPDVIIVDIEMPFVNGEQIVEYIKNSNYLCDIPTFIVSGSYNNLQRVDTEGMRISAKFSKPFTKEDLIGALKSIRKFWHMTTLQKA